MMMMMVKKFKYLQQGDQDILQNSIHILYMVCILYQCTLLILNINIYEVNLKTLVTVLAFNRIYAEFSKVYQAYKVVMRHK